MNSTQRTVNLPTQTIIKGGVCALSAVFFLSNCASVSFDENMVTGTEFFEDVIASGHSLQQQELRDYPRLRAAYAQITGRRAGQDGWSVQSVEPRPLPHFFLEDAATCKIVRGAYLSVCENRPQKISMTAGDTKHMIRMIHRHFGASAHSENTSAKDKDLTTYRIIRRYLMAYYESDPGYIDRFGTVYKRPEIKGSIGNDVITAVVAVVVEGLLDSLLVEETQMPAWYEKEEKKPTVVKLGLAKKGKLVEVGAPDGIDKYELKAMNYLANLAGDQSKLASGAVIRVFGDLELGFVVGGNFSFGDNDTFAKVLETVFEVTSKRLAMELGYQAFQRFEYTLPGGRVVPEGMGLMANDSESRQVIELVQEMSLSDRGFGRTIPRQ